MLTFISSSSSDLASGGSVDYTYDAEGVKYSFAIELRDTGRYGKHQHDTTRDNMQLILNISDCIFRTGFELPPDQITSTAEETFAGLKAMAQEIAAQRS